MVFSSLVFLNCFLPAVLLSYFLAPKSWRNPILLAASIFFYGYGEPRYLTIMLLCVAVNYIFALAIENSNSKRLRGLLTGTAVILNCANLLLFKYLDFILENINLVLPQGADIPVLKLVMPIGISFYTFQAVSYIIDVHSRSVKAQKNIFDLALFIMFFPQLIAGPILKYHEFGPQIEAHDTNISRFASGLRRFICGLGKKVLLANTIGIFAERFFQTAPEQLPVWLVWAGTAAYAIQIYFDFSGYSDMAIGLGAMFGFNIPENFNYPYVSRSITEFWRRWHISLSTWVRDYLYFPLGGSRGSTLRTCINTMVVFTAVGLWHGASWSFAVWGAWFGLLMVAERVSGYRDRQEKIPKVFQHIYFVTVYLISIVIFMTSSLTECLRYLKRMFGFACAEHVNYIPIDTPEIVALIIGTAAMFPTFKLLWKEQPNSLMTVFQNIISAVILYLSFAFLCGATYNPFIYFRF